MTSSKIYYLKDSVGVWCIAYDNGNSWRVCNFVNREIPIWFDWVGNPVRDLCMKFLCKANNIKEKPDVSN